MRRSASACFTAFFLAASSAHADLATDCATGTISGTTTLGFGMSYALTGACELRAPGALRIEGGLFNNKGQFLATNALTHLSAQGSVINAKGALWVLSGGVLSVGSIGDPGSFTNLGTLRGDSSTVSVRGSLKNLDGGVVSMRGGATLTNFETMSGILNQNGSRMDFSGASVLRNGTVITNDLNARIGLASNSTWTNVDGAKVMNRNGSTIALGGGSVLSNLYNATMVNEHGATLTNESGGTLINSDGAVLTNRLGALLDNQSAGVIRNQGGASIVNQQRGMVTNNSTLLNTGRSSILNEGDAAGSTSGTSTILNSGTGARLINEAASVLTNRMGGVIVNVNGAALINGSGAQVVNSHGAAIQNLGLGALIVNTGSGSVISNGSGASVTNTQGAVITNQTGASLLNNGLITNSGSLENSGLLVIGATGRVTGTGTVTQTGTGVLDVAGEVRQASISVLGGTLQGHGVLIGQVTLRDALFHLGTQTGDFRVDGSLGVSDSTLVFKVGGLDLFDQLLVTGPTSLSNSTLRFDFSNGFDEMEGQSFDFLRGSNIIWNNLTVQATQLREGIHLSVTQIDGGLRVTLVPEPTSWLLAMGGVLSLAAMGRRRPTRQYA